MKCIVRGCPSDGVKEVKFNMPKGSVVAPHTVMAQEAVFNVKMCLLHHRKLTTHNVASFSIRDEP